jgi:UDP-hydrolysing UDP-N-acetyl-D-glucosamine 2-epimerase
MTPLISKRLIDVVSTSSADYAHATKIAQSLGNSPNVTCRLILTGTHTPSINAQDKSHFLLVSGLRKTVVDKCDAMSQEIQQFTKFWAKRAPDACVLIGDRFELLPIASVTMIFDIPLAHFFGGECDTSTCFDNDARNAITKLAHLHYVSHDAMKGRLRLLGEEEWRIQVTGNPAIANASGNADRFFRFAKKQGWGQGPFIAATYLPPTRDLGEIYQDLPLILAALAKCETYTVIWTGSNADPGSDRITLLLTSLAKDAANIIFSPVLGSALYQDLLAASRLIIGNSSSAILEAATYGLPAINIGSRQVGRLHSSNLINCTGSTLLDALDIALSPDFTRSIKGIVNPFAKSSGLDDFVAHLLCCLEDTPRLMVKYRDASHNKIESGLSRIALPNLPEKKLKAD